MAKSRSRMISDQFWNDADLVNYTVETRTTLLLFLTCMESNIIGVYRVNWRTVGAGLGWTREQSINAARLVAELGGIAIDEDTGWIWVKEWWKHNSLAGAFTGNVAKPARQELERVPDFWKSQVLDWIKITDTEGACKGLISSLGGAGGNPNPIFISNTTPTPNISAPQRAGGGGHLDLDLSNLHHVRQSIDDGLDLEPVMSVANGQQVVDQLEFELRQEAAGTRNEKIISKQGLLKKLAVSPRDLTGSANIRREREEMAMAAEKAIATASEVEWKNQQARLVDEFLGQLDEGERIELEKSFRSTLSPSESRNLTSNLFENHFKLWLRKSEWVWLQRQEKPQMS